MDYHRTVYRNMWATSLTPEQHERTCNYWFTVTCGATAHTAFETRAGLSRWLSERGLTLAEDLPEAGTWGLTRVIGEYSTVSHGECSPTEDDPYRMVAGDTFSQLHPVMATAVMSNGRYTLGLITDEDGARVVHYLNPNVKTRVVFDQAAAARYTR